MQVSPQLLLALPSPGEAAQSREVPSVTAPGPSAASRVPFKGGKHGLVFPKERRQVCNPGLTCRAQAESHTLVLFLLLEVLLEMNPG